MSRGGLIDGPTRLLHVEDNESDAVYLGAVLASAEVPYAITHCETLAAAQAHLAAEDFDVVLLDLYLPDSMGLRTLELLRLGAPDVPIVVCTSDVESAREDDVLASSAQDFVPKWNGATDHVRLDLALRHAISRNRWFQALRRSQRQVVDVLDAADVGLFVVTGAGVVPMMNTHAGVVCGGPPGAPRAEVLTGVPDLGERAILRVEPEQWLSLSSNPIDWEGKPARLVTVRDVTEQTRADIELQRMTDNLQVSNAQLSRLVLQDPLTSVSNRRGFERALVTELAASARHGWPICAALIDCDSFKLVNDTFGHDGGDVVLRTIADRATAALRTTDHIARVGGDEFLLLLPNAGVWQASRVAERVRLRVNDKDVQLTLGNTRVSVSIGVAQVPPSTKSIDEVLQLCRAALAGSKAAGKNTVQVHGVSEPAAAAVRASLQREDTFVSVARPIVNLVTDAVDTWSFTCRSTIEGFETPIDYLALARDLQVLASTDSACAHVSAREIRRVLAHDPTMPVLLHGVAGSSRDQPDMVDLMCALAAERPTVMVVNEVVSTGQALAGAYDRVRAAGLRIGVNNVGTGAISLDLLASIRPDVALLSTQVLEDARGGGEGRKRAEQLVRVLTGAGARVVGKGVASPRDVKVLSDIGVTLGKGPLWNRRRIEEGSAKV